MEYYNYVAVIGRVCGDEEDSLLTYEHVTRQEAAAAFEKEMCEEEGDDNVEVIINYIVVSEAPIELIYTGY